MSFKLCCVLAGLMLVVGCRSAANTPATSPTTQTAEARWTERLDSVIREITDEKQRLYIIAAMVEFRPTLTRDPMLSSWRETVARNAQSPDPEWAKSCQKILERWDLAASGRVKSYRDFEVEEELKKLESDEPVSVYSLGTDLRNANRRGFDRAQLDRVIAVMTAWLGRHDTPHHRGNVALVLQGWAMHAFDLGDQKLANELTDRVVVLMKSGASFQDPKRGNTDGLMPNVLIHHLVKLNRYADIDAIAAAREDGVQLRIGLIADHLAKGDTEAARKLAEQHLADHPAAKAHIDAAIAGKSLIDPAAPIDLPDPVEAMAAGAARSLRFARAARGEQVEPNPAPPDDREKGESYIRAQLKRAEIAMNGGRFDEANGMLWEAWAVYQRYPREAYESPGELAEASARAGDAKLLLEIARKYDRYHVVSPLVKLARQKWESGDRSDVHSMIRLAEKCAMLRPAGDAGPPKSLMQVAELYEQIDQPHLAANATMRATLENERMNDPFFFGIGNYGTIIATARKMGRPELVDRAYATISRPVDRAVFCLALP